MGDGGIDPGFLDHPKETFVGYLQNQFKYA
jgi:hypothetical protein